MRTFYGLLAVVALAAGNVAHAIPVTFDLSGDSYVSVNSQCLGCSVSATLNPSLGSLSNTLSAGQTWSFDFFTLQFSGVGIGSGSIFASLAFDSPLFASDAVGAGVGSFGTLFGITAGKLIWDNQPGTFTLADGTSYSIEFEDLYGIDVGSVTVGARITLYQEPSAVSVPEPSVLGLFGLGLIGLALSARRRRSVA